MRFLKSKRVVHIALLTIFVMSVVGGTVSSAAGAEPGTAGDPVVSQSYVDAKVNDLTNQINALKQQIQSGGQEPSTQSAKYVILDAVPAGKKIIAGASTEIVLRGGSATAIGSQYGGVADLISGSDLATGADIPVNHLLLVARDDGRGIAITTKAWVMIRGSYTIN